MLITNHLKTYKTAIRSLPSNTRPFTKEDLQAEPFLMERSGKLEMYYSPHNEYVNREAKIVIIGITPGWTQMKTAFHSAREGLEQGLADEQVCKKAKEEAGFAGAMRHNLVNMLNALDLQQYLNIASCELLFRQHRHLLNTTSLLRFPVFMERRNYTGSHPPLLTMPFFEVYIELLHEELQWLKRSLIIPLGRTVERALHVLEREGKLDACRCLWGFPHPSGANGHRLKQFSANAGKMKKMVESLSGTALK